METWTQFSEGKLVALIMSLNSNVSFSYLPLSTVIRSIIIDTHSDGNVNSYLFSKLVERVFVML